MGASTYEGVQFYAFLDPFAAADATSDIVMTGASDGYLVVFSLAELDPALGGNPNNLLAYAGAASFARIVAPDDRMHGRWNSNLVSIEVGVDARSGGPGVGDAARRFRRAWP